MKIERIQQEKIYLKNGEQGLLSIARLPDGRYETILLDHTREEIVSAIAAEKEAALATFRYFKLAHSGAALKGRYKKLAEDLKAAYAYGLKHQGPDDGGTCNFDAPTIYLRGWNRKMIEAAAAVAGGSCSFWSPCGSYIFPIPGTGQGNSRTAAAEAAKDYLEAHGYDAGMYYQID